jgi:hypothetical protein
MIVSETQRLSWQRDILNEARRQLVTLRASVGHGQAIDINALELIGRKETINE